MGVGSQAMPTALVLAAMAYCHRRQQPHQVQQQGMPGGMLAVMWGAPIAAAGTGAVAAPLPPLPLLPLAGAPLLQLRSSQRPP